MKVSFIYDSFVGESKKTKEITTFYVVRLALQKDNETLRKSQPLLWLTKEQYEELISSK